MSGQLCATLLSGRATTVVPVPRLASPSILPPPSIVCPLCLDSLCDDALVDTGAPPALQPGSFNSRRNQLHKERYDESNSHLRTALEQAESDGADGDVRALRGELKRSSAVLKRRKTKDYSIVRPSESPRDCNEADIKKAHRQESLKHHPDEDGGD